MKWYARLANQALKAIASSMKTQYGTPSETDRGESVRSNGEKRVADYLNQSGIRYEYEKKVFANGRPYCPDFYLPQYNVYIEYAGMWDNFSEYRIKNTQKADDYKKAGINCLFVFPKDLGNLDYAIKTWLK